jgi:hypothetical protein
MLMVPARTVLVGKRREPAMAKLFKGDVSFWVNIPDDGADAADAAKLINWLTLTLAETTPFLGVGAYVTDVQNVTEVTAEDFAANIRARMDADGMSDEEKERINAHLDMKVEAFRQAAQAATV